MSFYKIRYLILTYKFINHLFYEVTHNVSDRKYTAIDKTIIVSFWFLWFLADSRLNRENFNANPKICAQLVVTNGKIEIHRHAPHWREVLNSRKVVDLFIVSAIAVAVAIAHFCFHYSLYYAQGPS